MKTFMLTIVFQTLAMYAHYTKFANEICQPNPPQKKDEDKT